MPSKIWTTRQEHNSELIVQNIGKTEYYNISVPQGVFGITILVIIFLPYTQLYWQIPSKNFLFNSCVETENLY